MKTINTAQESQSMKVSPSIISSKLEILKEQVLESVEGGADSFHIDIMDGNFVPNITVGQDFIRAVRRVTDIHLDAHMMILNPEKYWKSFADSGADLLYFHYETPFAFQRVLKEVKGHGKKIGMVINPDTPAGVLADFLPQLDRVLVMTVHPGFSGQKFIQSVLPKIREIREMIDSTAPGVQIEVDGGINNITGKMVKDQGADIIVSASYIYDGNIREKISILKGL
jgi:ribulose-phosphate 3-epimerase